MNQDSKPPLDENARLMRKASDGDIDAFNRLYGSYGPLLKQFFVIQGTNRNTAEDLAQKIFSCLWRQRKTFRGESFFEAYLYSAARNTLHNEIRRSRRITELSSKKQPVCDDIYKTLSQPEAEFHLQELTEALEAAKAELTTEQRQALDAFQDSDIASCKTSEGLTCSKGAYKSHLKRARKRLRVLLAPFFSDEERRKKS